jgi:glycerophosphoryl diester phosphodiesterase
MLDRGSFIRPIAHRGLHDASRGVIENTFRAFDAAITKGYGIECDLRPAAGGLPVVFHDETLERLTESSGALSALGPDELARVRFKGSSTTGIQTFADFLAQAGGLVPLLVEVKSEWEPPDAAFVGEIAKLASAYRGPLALMSFDPAVMVALKALAPGVPRGLVSGSYKNPDGTQWWADKLPEPRAYDLSQLLESGPAAPHFFAYHVKSLPSPITRFVREVVRMPLFTWTVRSDEDRLIAAQWADAPIFEGFEA